MAYKMSESNWKGGEPDTRDGQPMCGWLAEKNDLVMQDIPEDWSSFSSLKMQLYSPKWTDARIMLSAVNSLDEPVYQTTFAVKWTGMNDMQLWLPVIRKENKSGDIRCLKLSCTEKGLYETALFVGAVELTEESPAWKVNESDTVVEMGWRADFCNYNEWELLSSENVRAGEELKIDTRVGMGVGFMSGHPGGGKVTFERKFDLDIRGYDSILLKMNWVMNSLLTVVAEVEDENITVLDKKDPPTVNLNGNDIAFYFTFGADIRDKKRLKAVRISVEEKPGEGLPLDKITAALFWIILRKEYIPRNIAEIPVNSRTPIGDMEKDGLPFEFFVKRDQLSGLKARLSRDANYQEIFDNVLSIADKDILSKVVEKNYYNYKKYSMGSLGVPIGVNAAGLNLYLPCVVIAWLFTGEEKYALTAREWLLRAARSPVWNGADDGQTQPPEAGDIGCYQDSFTGTYPLGWGGWMNNPFHVATSTFMVSLGYDLLYHCLSDEERKDVREALRRNGVHQLYDKLRHDRGFYLTMNQGPYFATPLLMAATILKDEDPVMEGIARWAYEFIDEMGRGLFKKDGGHNEGPGYANSSLFAFVRSWYAAAAYLKKEIPEILPQNIDKALDYLLHMSSLSGKKPKFINFSDGDTNLYINMSVAAFFANHLGNPYAQWLWENRERWKEADDPGDMATDYGDSYLVSYLEMLYYGPKVKAESIKLPPAKIFSSVGLAFLRTGSGYGDTMMAMNCLPYTNGGHAHLDRGNFIMDYNGERLLMDPGMINYSDPRCETMHMTKVHNCLTCGQNDQLRDADGALLPGIKGFLSTSGETTPGRDRAIDWVSVDPAPLYPELVSYRRDFIYLRPGIFIVLDDAEAARETPFELNFNLPRPMVGKDGRFMLETDKNRLLLMPHAAFELEHRQSEFITRFQDSKDHRITFETTRAGKAFSAMTLILPSALEDGLPSIEKESCGGSLSFHIRHAGAEERICFKAQDNPAFGADGRIVVMGTWDEKCASLLLVDGMRADAHGNRFILSSRTVSAGIYYTEKFIGVSVSGRSGTKITFGVPTEWTEYKCVYNEKMLGHFAADKDSHTAEFLITSDMEQECFEELQFFIL